MLVLREYASLKKIDLIKIDTEGAEYEILKSFDKKALSNTKWIAGELHGMMIGSSVCGRKKGLAEANPFLI